MFPLFFASVDILSDFYVFFNHNFNIFQNNSFYIQKSCKLARFRCAILHDVIFCTLLPFVPALKLPDRSFRPSFRCRFFCFFYFSPSSRSIFRFIENRVMPSSAAARVRLLPESFSASDIYRFSSAATSCSRSIGPFFRSFR